jgi:carbon-monoxide dehydrogenase medium subunit/xanthine dehydrogenase FAD-binding subunit
VNGKLEKVIKAWSLGEALEALKAHPGDSEVIAGGTDLLVKIREKHNKKSVLVDISDLTECQGIAFEADRVVIGACTKYSALVNSAEVKEKLPGLWEAARSVGAPQIRNLGTIGGNIANASPAADAVPPLLVLEAVLEIESARGKRTVELRHFFKGKGEADLNDGEILTQIVIPRPGKEAVNIQFEKLGLRNALAISRLSAAVALDVNKEGVIEKACVASGSLGLVAMREPEMEAFLIGKTLNESLTETACDVFSNIVESRLSGRGTMPFKREAIKGVFGNAMRKSLASSVRDPIGNT